MRFINKDMKSDSPKATQYINQLIQSGEGQKLDFKFEINDAKKIAKTLSAFSNTNGGKLLIGVKDNGKISGIQSDEEAYMVESAAALFCRPEVSFRLKKWFVDGKCVLEVNIPQSKSRPHFAKDDKGKWMAYVRVGDQNMQANRVLVSVWKNQSKKISAFISFKREEQVLIDYLEQYGEISFTKFLKIARISRRQAENILVNLILMNAIEIVVTRQSVRFIRKNAEETDSARNNLGSTF